MAFINDDFLLTTKAAKDLYHGYAEQMPIIDYHCHLPPAEIAQDRRWRDLAEVWLGADHYKWRVMRTDGVDERFVTGDAPAREKFQKFAEAMPHALRNPMYHWCHLELARYFGIDDLLLSGDTAEAVWDRANAIVAQPWFSARGLIARSNVEALCTTDDPVDSLEHHAAVAADASFKTKVLPAWRPDKGFAIGGGAVWNAWVDKLAAAADADIATFDDFLAALRKRHAFFAERGCRISDYGLNAVLAEPCADAELRAIFAKARGGAAVTPEEYEKITGVAPVGGEEGMTLTERNSFRPTIEVNGIHSGYGGPGSKTVIPAGALAKLSMRLVPNQNPDEVMAAVERHLKLHTPRGMKLFIEDLTGEAAGFRLPLASPVFRLAASVLEELDPRGAVYQWDGASIPVVSTLKTCSGAAPLLVGFGQPEDRIHSPNESYGLNQFARAMAWAEKILGNLI